MKTRHHVDLVTKHGGALDWWTLCDDCAAGKERFYEDTTHEVCRVEATYEACEGCGEGATVAYQGAAIHEVEAPGGAYYMVAGLTAEFVTLDEAKAAIDGFLSPA